MMTPGSGNLDVPFRGPAVTPASSRRDRILAAIEDFSREYGHSTSVRDIARSVGLWEGNAVTYHLRVLERTGLVRQCRCGCGRYMSARYEWRLAG